MYEVIYKYHERDEKGEYNKTETKEMKKKVGSPTEEVALEKLASVVMSQLARRDIWVIDVKIFEFVKKEISFKETKGGIVIRNRKFILDGSNIVTSSEEEVTTIPQAGTNLVPASNHVSVSTLPPRPTKPIKWVVLDPDLRNLDTVKRAGLAFLPDKRYPVFSETPHTSKFGVMIYSMQDEQQRNVTVMDEYFLAADQILQRGFSMSVDKGGPAANPKLTHDSYISEPEMLDIRSR